MKLKVKKLNPKAILPKKATEGASGHDLFACIDDGSITLDRDGDPQLVPTGIAIEIPSGFDAQIRPRSGLSLKGVGVTFGTIDSDYRGELKVALINLGTEHFRVTRGMRIAQLVFARVESVTFRRAAELGATSRGEGGFGSTGH